MEPQDAQSRRSVISELMGVLYDHWELALLELGQESTQALRRLLALVIGFLFILLAMIVAQVSVIYALMAAGLTPAWACVGVSSLYGLIGVLILMRWGRRDPRAGCPFAGTRKEVGRTLQWIQKLFS